MQSRRGRMSSPVVAALLIAASGGCSGPGSDLGAPEPVPWVDLAPATDVNPDPNIVEIDIEARAAEKAYLPGKTTAVWSYNGTVPGPLIDAKVGDTLIVHFKNSLPDVTTIHWHGVRVPNAMDGAMAVQTPIKQGETFTYQFQLEDAGLFWFHPHVAEDVQIQRGLYGVIRVRGPSEPTADDERIVVLDDVLLNKDGSFVDVIDDDIAMLGREGNVLLINGVTLPRLEWRAGAAERLRIVNVANGRFFNLALDGYTFHVIGTDGGFIPKPYDTEKLLIAPGERYDVMLVAKGEPGAEVTLMDEPYDRGHDTGKAPPMALAKLRVRDEAPIEGRILPGSFAAIERLPGAPADTTLVFDEKFVNGKLEFWVNGKMFPDVPPLDTITGSLHVLDLQNDAQMDHPFHLHGFFFQVLEKDGVALPDNALANKDTLILPQKSTTRVVARFDRPGKWMYHCHILEHAERGMMGEIDVSP